MEEREAQYLGTLTQVERSSFLNYFLSTFLPSRFLLRGSGQGGDARAILYSFWPGFPALLLHLFLILTH